MEQNVRLLVPLVGVFVLIVAGWGLDDVPGFFAHPARAGLVVLAVVDSVIGLLLKIDVQIFRRGRAPIGRQPWFLAVVLVAFVWLVWFLPHADRRGILVFAGADWLRYLGLVLTAVGDAVALAALHSLAKQYSAFVTLQDDHELVTTGIYGVIRHPIYVRGILLSVGLPLVFRSWLVVVVVPLVFRVVTRRMREEEALLAGRFGEAYDAYRRRTWRLAPYVD